MAEEDTCGTDNRTGGEELTMSFGDQMMLLRSPGARHCVCPAWVWSFFIGIFLYRND